MRIDAAPAALSPAKPALARARAFVELTKPRVTFLVLFTAFVGFHCGNSGALPCPLLLHTLAGTALAAGGAAAFNMYLERKVDAKMTRTALRPLASGRLPSSAGLLFAIGISIGGFLYLFIFVNHLTASLSAAIFAGYLLLYTPLKRKTWLCTLVGAVPGALPIVMGWTGANAALSPGAWALFGIVFLWQIPHFYSIGWMYRDEYAQAGLTVLSVIDSRGRRTGRQVVSSVLLLLMVSTVPAFLGLEGMLYLIGALALGLAFLAFGFHFANLPDRLTARRLFLFSAIYLPALLLLLVIDKS